VRAGVLVVSALLLSGCVTELLGDEVQTVRNVACAVLAHSPRVEIHVHAATELDMQGPVSAFIAELAPLRDPATVSVVTTPTDLPTDLDAWSMEQMVLERDRAVLHVLVREGTADGPTFEALDPGVFVLDVAALQAGAQATGRDLMDVTRIVFLHAMGHELGVVNAGIPLNGTDLSGREGPMHHEPAPTSVMHVGWHAAISMPKSNSTYAGYSAAVHDDWAAAVAGGICA